MRFSKQFMLTQYKKDTSSRNTPTFCSQRNSKQNASSSRNTKIITASKQANPQLFMPSSSSQKSTCPHVIHICHLCSPVLLLRTYRFRINIVQLLGTVQLMLAESTLAKEILYKYGGIRLRSRSSRSTQHFTVILLQNSTGYRKVYSNTN